MEGWTPLILILLLLMVSIGLGVFVIQMQDRYTLAREMREHDRKKARTKAEEAYQEEREGDR